jgi:hypothetical protein
MEQGKKKYKGWNVRILSNNWIKLFIVPQLGGRIIQIDMKGYEFLFNNPLLLGMEPDETRLGKNGTWLNFGGEKIWPAPQGWDSSQKWPGPPDPILDSGIYSADNIFTSENGKRLTVSSPFDKRTGLQITKEVFMPNNRSVVKVIAAFLNRNSEIKKWSVWPVLQMNTQGDDIYERYRIICPINSASKFEKGFKVMHGLVNNPQNSIDIYGNLIVNYKYLVGKVGLDTKSGWMAFLDLQSGKIFILSFDYQENEFYPENTSAQIWTQGRGIIYSRNRVLEFKNDKRLNPPYIEMEILSPLQEIKPAESIHFKYRMFCSTIPPDTETVKDISELGIIAQPLSMKTKGDNIFIEAKYGVFNEGTIKIMARHVSQAENGEILFEKKVSPLLGINVKLNYKNKLVFNNKYCLSTVIFDESGYYLGELELMKLHDKI